MDLACPYDGGDLTRQSDDRLSCRQGHDFPIVHGVPVLVRADVAQTHHLWRTTPDDVSRLSAQPLERLEDNVVDPFVERSLVATSGNLYRGITLPLPRYPIPRFPLPDGRDRTLLDVGSNWGRWALAAARAGYRCVAVDPSLQAALAGTRIAQQLQLPVSYVVADARHLPFPRDSFDACFSYSVLQHLDKRIVEEVLCEVGRVARPQAMIAIQMANGLGLRQLANRAQQGLHAALAAAAGRSSPPYDFRVRFWTPPELLATFERLLGPARLSADGFLSLNAQAADIDLLPRFSAGVVRVSQLLCALARAVPAAARVADSVLIEATNAKRAATTAA